MNRLNEQINRAKELMGILKEQTSDDEKGDVGSIEGVSTSLLHPLTQKWIGGGKNVFDMIKMILFWTRI
mgnify:CR=1 FL=1